MLSKLSISLTWLSAFLLLSNLDNIIIAYLKDDMIIYERTKYDKQTRVIIIVKVAEVIERYRNEAYMNYYQAM